MSFGGNAAPLRFIAEMVGESETANMLQSLGGAFQNFGKTADDASKNVDKADKATKSVGTSLKESALSFSTAATNLTSLAFQFGDLEKRELRVDTAHKAVLTSNAALIAAQDNLNKLVAKGTTSGSDYEKAQLTLQAAQENLANKTQALDIAQGDLTQSQTMFALSVVPTVLSSISALAAAQTALKGVKLGSAAASGAEAGADGASALAKIGHAAASGLATAAIYAQAAASRVLEIASGPVGWVLLGIGAVMTLVATNAFGVRDALADLAKKAEEALPFLKPLFDAISQVANAIFPQAEAKSQDLASTFDSQFDKIQGKFTDLSKTANTNSTSVVNSTATMATQSETNFDKLGNSATGTAGEVEDAARRIREAMASIGGASASLPTISVNTPSISTMPAPTAPALNTPSAAPSTVTTVPNREALIADVTSQITAVQAQIKQLGGGLSIDTLRGLGFGIGGKTDQVSQAINQLDALNKQLSDLRTTTVNLNESLGVTDRAAAQTGTDMIKIDDKISTQVTRKAPDIASPITATVKDNNTTTVALKDTVGVSSAVSGAGTGRDVLGVSDTVAAEVKRAGSAQATVERPLVQVPSNTVPFVVQVVVDGKVLAQTVNKYNSAEMH